MLRLIILIIGFVVLIKGADIFVDGASSLAGNFNVPKMLVGLTIVAFGTSAPEFAVSVKAMFSHSGDMVLGNVIGSNIINILLILGVTALIKPIKVKSTTVRKEIPIVLMLTLALSTLMMDKLFDKGVNSILTRGDGLVLILFFGVFMYYLLSIAIRNKRQLKEKEVLRTYEIPIQVGAELTEARICNVCDNTGENISKKNASYCELTGLYWAWKNLDSEFLGLAHYRRHFSIKKKSKNPFDNILTANELAQLTQLYSVFVPKKRKYYIETLYSHYAHTHYSEHLDVTKQIISEKCSEYLESCEKVYKQTSGFMFNMMIMRKDLFDDYCQWLFDILFELENRIGDKAKELSFFQGRFYGRVSEIIFNVWLDYQIKSEKIKKSEIKEIPCIYTEKIAWLRKIRSFISAKFGHKKYEGSF